jgi:hypothetical protein
MEKYYFVISHKEGDILQIQEELAAEGGSSFVPNRSCVSPDLMLESSTASIWSLTELEVETLKQDPRIKTIFLAEEEEDEDDEDYFHKAPFEDFRYVGDVNTTYTGPQDFYGDASKAQPELLALHSSKNFRDPYKETYTNTPIYEGKYESVSAVGRDVYNDIVSYIQADGTGVDIVVYDRPFGADYNPEFEGRDGYRMKMVNWFEEAGYPEDHEQVVNFNYDAFYATTYNDHGTGVATTAAGKYNGWAKGAHIFAAKPYTVTGFGDEFNHPARFLSLVTEWHKRKMLPDGNKRPTVLVSSNSNLQRISQGDLPTRGRYRGVDWEYNNETREELAYKYGLVLTDKASGTNIGGINNEGEIYEPISTSYFMEECFKAGITVIRSSSNSGLYMDLPANTINPIKDFLPDDSPVGLDYNNWIQLGDENSKKYYYHRPNGPHFDGCIRAGELKISSYLDSQGSSRSDGGISYNFIERAAKGSGNGPAVSLYSHTGSHYITQANYVYPPNPDSSSLAIGLKDHYSDNDWQNWSYTKTIHGYDPRFITTLFGGTSAAAPSIAGVIACYLQVNPELTPTEVHRKLLEDSAREALNREAPVVDIDAYYDHRVKRKDAPELTSKVLFNPYWERRSVNVSGTVDLHSATYLNNSTLSSNTDFLLLTRVDEYLNQSTLTVENALMTTQNNSTTVTLQVKDDNNVNVTTDDLVVSFVPTVGTVGDVESQGNGIYTTTYFAPAVGDGNATIKAKIYGQEIVETATIYYQGQQLQEPPVVDVGVLAGVTDTGSVNNVRQFSFLENTGSGLVKAAVFAESDYAPLTFSLLAGSSSNIDLTTYGEGSMAVGVTYTATPDYETEPNIPVNVRVTDSLGNYSDISLQLNLVNVDDTGPVFTNGLTHTAASINEHTQQNQVVYTASASDTGDGTDGVVTYSLPEDTGVYADVLNSSFFSINSSTGELTLTEDISYEDHQNISAKVLATDSAGNVSEQQVTFPINNVDELKPIFTSSAHGGSIVSGGALNAVVYTAVATDTGDGTDGVVAYNTEAGYQASSFVVNSSSGELSLLSTFDHAVTPEAKVTIKATDSAGNFQTKTITFDIVSPIDVTAPVITSSPTATSINENSGSGQVVYTAVATDTSYSVLYSLTVDSDDDVSIDNVSGEVTLNVNPDFETKNQYIFTVLATDAAGNVGRKTVTLNINNVDEVPPVFSQSLYSTQTIFTGTTSQDTLVIQVQASDSNETTDGVITYSFVGDVLSSLSILANGSIIIDQGTAVTIDDFDGYQVTVRATDAAGNYADAVVTLNVETASSQASFKNNGPNSGAKLPNTSTQFEIIDGIPTRTMYINADYQGAYVGYTPSTSEGTQTITFTNKNFSDSELTFMTFGSTIQSTILMNGGSLDVSAQSQYTYTVTLTDTAADEDYVENVIINFDVIDTTAPVIDSSVVVQTLYKGTPFPTTLYSPEVNEDVTWDFVLGDGTGSTAATPDETSAINLLIDASSGGVYVMNSSNVPNNLNTLSYTIRATDASGNQSTAFIQHTLEVATTGDYEGAVVVDLSDVSNHPVVGLKYLNVNENTPAGTVVLDLKAVKESSNEDLPDGQDVYFDMPLSIPQLEIVGDELRTTNVPFDYEFSTSQTISLRAYTDYWSDSNETVGLWFLIQDVNEAPVWSLTPNQVITVDDSLAYGDIIIPNLNQLVNDPDDTQLLFEVATVGGPNTYYLDGASVKSHITTSTVGTIQYPLRLTVTDGDGLTDTVDVYVEIVATPEDSKYVTGKTATSGGNYYGYRNENNNLYGSISPNDDAAVDNNADIQRLHWHSYYSKQFYYKANVSGSYNSNTWTRIKIVYDNDFEQNLYKSSANFVSNTGYYWTVPSNDAGFAQAVADEQFRVEWWND